MSDTMTASESHVAAVRDGIAAAERQAGRAPSSVRLLAVTKYVGADEVRALHRFGCRDFGENRWQHAQETFVGLADPAADTLDPPPTWHFIGPLQRNKARPVAEHFDWLHSGDRVELLDTLDRVRGEAVGRTRPPMKVFLEVNVGGEAQKHGFSVEAVRQIRSHGPWPHLEIVGLMTMIPLVAEPSAGRGFYRRLRDTAEALSAEPGWPIGRELSMGLSHDFADAIAEGATWVRVGSALFDGTP
jgi:pyridoxal phosphate enzyme (YggS family)